MKTTIKLERPLLPIVVGVVFLLYLLESYQVWFILSLGLGSAWGISYLWAYSLSKSLTLTREQRYGWANVGDMFEERITIHNAGRIPALWLELNYHSTLPGYAPGRATGVPARSNNRWIDKGVCIRRGIFELGPIDMVSGDPLGIYSVSHHLPEQTSMLVTPPIIQLPGIEVAAGGRVGEGTQRRKSFEVTMNVSNVREFEAGDSMRLIHWPTTARRDDIFVKVMDNTPASDWWIFLDLDESVQYGQGNLSTEEHAVILAASISERGLHNGNAVGLATHGKELVWLPPRFGGEQRQKILHELARATCGKLPLSQLLYYARPIFRQNPSLIIISSNLDPTWTNELSTFLGSGIVPTVLLLDPTGYAPNGDRYENPQKMLDLLSELGIACYLFDAETFNRPELNSDVQTPQRPPRKWLTASAGSAEWKPV